MGPVLLPIGMCPGVPFEVFRSAGLAFDISFPLVFADFLVLWGRWDLTFSPRVMLEPRRSFDHWFRSIDGGVRLTMAEPGICMLSIYRNPAWKAAVERITTCVSVESEAIAPHRKNFYHP